MGIYRGKSYPEQYIGYICKQNFNHVDLNKKMVNGLEADIVIYDLNTIIEYSGVYWHTDEERDEYKRKFIEQHGIRLITIYEYRVNRLSEEKIIKVDKDTLHFYKASNKSNSLDKVVTELSKMLNIQLKVEPNIENKVHEMVDANYHDQCLAVQYPDIAAELLDYDPYKVTVSDTRTFNWKCSTCENIFSTTAAHRIYDNSQCPYCCGNKAIPGKTDIVTVLPGFAKEIKSLTEDELRNTLPYSTKQVTWRCSRCNHEWNNTISTRTMSKTRCPSCGYLPMTFNSGVITIYELAKNVKPLKKAIIFGKEVESPSYLDVFNLSMSYIFQNFDASFELIDSLDFLTSKNKKPIFSLYDNMYNIAGCINVQGIQIYYEKKYASITLINIIVKVINTLKIDGNNFLFEYDANKINNNHVKYISRAKNNRDWNVIYRLKIHEGDTKTQGVFIGSRPTFNEAVLLKLSSEIYYFGKIRDNTDTYFGDIPVFENTPEFEKLKQAGKIRKQY